MKRCSSLFVLACVFQFISCQGFPKFPPGDAPGFPENFPEKCRGPPKGLENPAQCCELEPFYTEDELESCGFKKGGEEDFKERRGPPDCSKSICLMKQKGLVDDSNAIDFPAVNVFLDTWAGSGNFQGAVETAKAICVQAGNVPGPPHICEHMRLAHCVGGVLFANCPQENWSQTDNCKALKDHIEECKGPFQ